MYKTANIMCILCNNSMMHQQYATYECYVYNRHGMATAESSLSIPPSSLPSSPHRSSPTGRTSGPLPDLPSATLLPFFQPNLSYPLYSSSCWDPLRHRAADSSDQSLFHTNNGQCSISSCTRFDLTT